MDRTVGMIRCECGWREQKDDGASIPTDRSLYPEGQRKPSPRTKRITARGLGKNQKMPDLALA